MNTESEYMTKCTLCMSLSVKDMCIKIIASLKIDIMARLILLLCVLHIWRYSKCEQGQLLSNNDYLFAIGNGKLLAASWLTNTVTISLDGYSVSSACGSHISRCRELLVESIETSNFTSKQVILVPLENGVQILELAYNGTSSNQLRLATQHSLLFNTVNGNHSCGPSLGIHKIGSDYFIPCIGTDDHYYVCQFTLNSTAITESTLQPCCQVNINLSNVETRVHFSSIIVTNESLIFLIQNVLYEFYPRSSSNPPFTDTFPTYCSLVSQLLISPQHNNQLLVYCRNQNTIVYDLNLHSITRTEGTSNIPYPCSPTAEYIVHLSQTQMEFSYKLNSDGDTVIRIFESPSSSVNYYSGVCFESTRGNHLFVYVDTSVGAYLFNATSENLWPIPNTLGCSQSECELPLVYSNRYIVVRNKLRRNVTVFDALFNRSIINLGDAPLQLVTLISDLPAISLQNVPPISTIVYKEPADSSYQSQDGKKGGVPLEVVVPVAILLILIVIILIAIIVIVVILIKKRCCSSRVDSGSYELDVKFAKQNHEIVIENHSIPESQPIDRIVAAELETEADNDSSYSNPVYSGESFDDHKEMPATVIVFENQVTSDSSLVDHDIGIQYPQDNSREQTVTDLSNSEVQNLIEPIKVGSDNDNLNVAASLEDNSPPSDNQGEVIVNVHALNYSLDHPNAHSQPESQPVPSTNQLIESGESPPPVNPQFTTEREEQTAGNGASSKLSTSADQEFKNGGQINDDAKERENEGDMTLRDMSTEHSETRGPLPPLNICTQLSAGREDQTIDTVTPCELSLSPDQHFEGGGSGDYDNKNKKSEGDRSENSIEYAETWDPPPQCTQLNSKREEQTADAGTLSELSLSPDQKFEGGGRNVQECEEDTSVNSIGHVEIGDPPLFPSNIIREEQFEGGGSISDDNEDRESDGERSDKLQPYDETTSELPVVLNGEEKQASSELLLSTGHDDAAHISDINDGESGNEDGEGSYGQEKRNSKTNKLLGSSNETESSVLDSNVPTEKAQSHDINQYQECTPIDSVLPESLPESATAPASTVEFPSLREDFSMDKEKECTNTESENLPEDEVISPSTDKLLGYTSETAVEDIGSDISQPSPHQERTDSNLINQEKEEHCEEENISQSRKSDFEAPAKELEWVVDQEDTGNCPKPGEANSNDNFEAPAKELKHVIDQEHTGDHLDTEEVNGDEENNNKHDFEASAEELECAMDQENLGDHLETEEVSGDKRDDSKQGDLPETAEVDGDKGEDNGDAFSQSADLLSVVVDQDNIENQSQVSVDAANEKHAPAHLGSSANSEESLTSSSIKSTNRQSDDDGLPSKSPVSTEFDLDMSVSSQEDVCKEKDKIWNGNMKVDKPTDQDESQSSQDYIFKAKKEAHNTSTEADKLETEDTVSINQEGEHNNTEAKTTVESSACNELLVPVESQEEELMEIAPIKCTFVGRTVKTVVRTSTGDTTSECTTNLHNYESYTVTGLPNTDTAASEENLTMPDGDSAKKTEPMENGDLSLVCVNGTFLTSKDDSMIVNQDVQKNEHISSDNLPNQEQKFPYKYETVI